MGTLAAGAGRTSLRLALLLGLAVVITMIGLVAYSIRVDNRRAECLADLKQIGQALQLYHDAYKRFPADIRDRDSRALLSWRVRILPFLGIDTLFAKFRLDEPWDSPHNKALLERMPAVFALPGGRAGPGMTFYRGFSGKDTLFDPTAPDGVDLATISDGMSNTIALVEAKEAVPWTKPEIEIAYTDEMRAVMVRMPLLGESRYLAERLHGKIEEPEEPVQPELFRPLREALGGHYPGGSAALYCDGTVRLLPNSINLSVLRALITRDQGELVSGNTY